MKAPQHLRLRLTMRHGHRQQWARLMQECGLRVVRAGCDVDIDGHTDWVEGRTLDPEVKARWDRDYVVIQDPLKYPSVPRVETPGAPEDLYLIAQSWEEDC